ncbi:hypothetical protein EVAR_5731_1 [Eumeta japonica]|uniref:Uncharacterized protein n=1 Tax=Eumeta variegata TaxID=151549 RepID=A0A4C1T737_EUMVA|nr:hypothetical protein EVAR_5731_1 [Eumeta japonica]
MWPIPPDFYRGNLSLVESTPRVGPSFSERGNLVSSWEVSAHYAGVVRVKRAVTPLCVCVRGKQRRFEFYQANKSKMDVMCGKTATEPEHDRPRRRRRSVAEIACSPLDPI